MRNYRITIDNAEEARAGTPPVKPGQQKLRTTWDFGDDRLHEIPALRRWISAAGIRDVEERGYDGTEDGPGDATLIWPVPHWVTDARVLGGELRNDETCGRCGLTTRRIHDDPRLELDRDPGEGPVLTFLRAAHATVLPVSALEALRAAGLDRGLGVAPIDAPGEPHVAVYAETALGEPVAPFGSTGERCPECGRMARRTARGRPAPGLPRFAFYWLFERPPGDSQWFWNTIEGQTLPMVAPEVGWWMHEHDPTMKLAKRGWSPDELDQAFLPEQYR